MLTPEDDNGNIEYKRYLINIDDLRFEQLLTQMKWRLYEGNNEAIYYIGVNNNGSLYKLKKNEIIESLFNLTKLIKKNNAEIIEFNKYIENDYIYFKIIIRKINIINPEIRVVLLGDNTKTGKTTFLANILLNKIDHFNESRLFLMNHKHEIETKRTSSFNCYYKTHFNIKFTFMETPGYNKYNKTKYKILLGTKPDICLLFTNNNLLPNDFDLFIVKTLNIPYIIINVFDSTGPYNCQKLIDTDFLFTNIIDTIKKYPINKSISKRGILFNILNVYPISSFGIIISGFLVSGCLKINTNILLTTKFGTIECLINSIYINNEPVKQCNYSSIVTICISPLTNQKIIKNSILTDNVPINKSKIIFNFINYSNKKLPNNCFGYFNNRLIYLSNIKTINKHEYEAQINNYYNDGNIIIIDNDFIKGIIIIKHLEF